MSEVTHPSFCRVEFKLFYDWNGDRPTQILIFRQNEFSWWIKVVVDWSLPELITELGYFQRRSLFQMFLQAIDFGQMQLLQNTVTKITLSLTDQNQNLITIRDGFQATTNYFIVVAHRLRYEIAEDPTRVIYPNLDRDLNIPTFEASCLQNAEFLAPTVFTVLFKQRKFAYKTIDRPIYEPGDTEHIMNEIDALAQFRGQPNIAQLVGLVASENPYKTCSSTKLPAVVTGFLLEYYTGGSLERSINEDEMRNDSLPIRWAIQIGTALESLHTSGRTHLDIKPSNIVLDANKNAILIDISGTGGYLWEWLSPEMQILIQQNIDITPANMPFGVRVATDCWAYGRLLSTIAEKCPPGGTGEKLRFIGEALNKAAPESRISLCDALAQLEDNRRLRIGVSDIYSLII
jgi:serine/threonine protein kinase